MRSVALYHFMLHCVAVWRVLQVCCNMSLARTTTPRPKANRLLCSVALCCTMSHHVALCRSVLQYDECCNVSLSYTTTHWQHAKSIFALCCTRLRSVALYCTMLHCDVCCNVSLWCTITQWQHAKSIAVCCAVLHYVVLQKCREYVVCCTALRCVPGVALCHTMEGLWLFSVLQCVAVCCSVLQCVPVCASVLQALHCAALWKRRDYVVCRSVLQCVAVCCSATCAATCW